MELQPVLLEELIELVTELLTEGLTECLDGQEEAGRRIDPSGTVEAQTTGRNDVVDMGMMLEVLSPSVEHAEEPDLRAEIPGIAGSFEQRRGTRSEERRVGKEGRSR